MDADSSATSFATQAEAIAAARRAGFDLGNCLVWRSGERWFVGGRTCASPDAPLSREGGQDGHGYEEPPAASDAEDEAIPPLSRA